MAKPNEEKPVANAVNLFDMAKKLGATQLVGSQVEREKVVMEIGQTIAVKLHAIKTGRGKKGPFNIYEFSTPDGNDIRMNGSYDLDHQINNEMVGYWLVIRYDENIVLEGSGNELKTYSVLVVGKTLPDELANALPF